MAERSNAIMITVNIKYKEVTPGIFIAQCIEFPSIIVKGNTVDDILLQLDRDMNCYFSIFPQKWALEICARLVEENKVRNKTYFILRDKLGDGWTNKKVKLAVHYNTLAIVH